MNQQNLYLHCMTGHRENNIIHHIRKSSSKNHIIVAVNAQRKLKYPLYAPWQCKHYRQVVRLSQRGLRSVVYGCLSETSMWFVDVLVRHLSSGTLLFAHQLRSHYPRVSDIQPKC